VAAGVLPLVAALLPWSAIVDPKDLGAQDRGIAMLTRIDTRTTHSGSATTAVLVAPWGHAARIHVAFGRRTAACLAVLMLTAFAAFSLPKLGTSLSAGSGPYGTVSPALSNEQAAFRIVGMSITNPAQRFTARFGARGAAISASNTRFSLGLTGFGRGVRIDTVAPVKPRVSGGVIRYAYPRSVTETWSNGPLGLEQAFVVSHRPSGAGALTLAMSAPAGARLVGGAVLLPGGLRYAELRVTDARGRVLHSWLALERGRLLIKVSDGGARYPLRVDPLVTNGSLSAADGAVGEYFGLSVAASGHTLVVGAPDHKVGSNLAQGAAYVFSDSSGSWKQVAELTASDGTAGIYLGTAVAISGSTIVASAPEAGKVSQQGVLYVYSDRSGSWKQVAELTASDALAGDNLGQFSVAISGNKIIAGEPHYAVGTNTGVGAVFVFHEPGGGWANETQSAVLTEPHPATDDYVGWAVGISGKTIVAGTPAPYYPQFGNKPASIFVFSQHGNHWAKTAQLIPKVPADTTVAPIGQDVAISGTTVVAPPYVFQHTAGKWRMTGTLNYTPICSLTLTDCGGAGQGTTASFLDGAILLSAGDESAKGTTDFSAVGAFREFAGKWDQVSATYIVKGGTGGQIASSGDTVAVGFYTGTTAGVVGTLKGTVPTTGPVIAGGLGVAGTGLYLPVNCEFSSACTATLTAYRFGTETIVGAGKATIRAGREDSADITLNSTGEHLLSKPHGFKTKVIVHLYVKGKLKGSGSTSITLT